MAYQRRMNILSTIVHNDSKVKEILSEQDENFDAIENIYLFGEQFEAKLAKITSAKQKLKSVFTGLQKKPASCHHTTSENEHQPF